MTEKELYVCDAYNKSVKHRLVYDSIVIVKTFDTSKTGIHTSDGRVILLDNSLSLVFDFYFKSHPDFIHASEHHVINRRHIVFAEVKSYDTNLKVTMSNKDIATLRRSHPYAYFIINGHPRKRKSSVEDTHIKDVIILSDKKKTKDIVDEIFKTTGEKVTSRYVVKRYKQLKINS